MHCFRKSRIALITLIVVTVQANASDLSIWNSWETLKGSWVNSNFEFKCRDDSYRIDRSLVGSISISLLGSDGNWKSIEGTKFSDTSVSFPSEHTIGGSFFNDDVVRLEPVQSLAKELRSDSAKQLEQDAKKKEEVRLSKKHSADVAYAKCDEEARKKYRPLYEKEKKRFPTDSVILDTLTEDNINQSFELRVRGECMNLEYNDFDGAIEMPSPKAVFDVAVDSATYKTSTSISFQSGEREIQVLDSPKYKINITVGKLTKEHEGTLSSFDEIHADRQMCGMIK